MAAVSYRTALAAVIIGGSHTQTDTRGALRSPDLSDQHDGDEHSAVLTKTGREVRYLDGSTLGISQSGRKHSRIGEIVLISLDLIVEFDDAETKAFACIVFTQQAAEDRVGVQAGQTTPHNLADLIYQRANVTVADQSQIKGATHLRPHPSENSSQVPL
jgi:hypothetical protein